MSQQVRSRLSLRRPAGRKLCRCSCLVSLRSMHIKICVDCGKEYPWPLRSDQKSLMGSNRADRRPDNG